MGPGCFHPRNVRIVRLIGPERFASMGPGCFHPRNIAPSATRPTPPTLQWGRDVSIPEMCKWGRNFVKYTASMGPGCFHPRNEGRFLDHPALPDASMGPGCFHPRNADTPESVTTLPGFNGAGMFPSQKYWQRQERVRIDAASMGPGCFHPRNIPPGSGSPVTTALQWGRDVSIPEIMQFAGGSNTRLSLQWGRDVSIPEIRPRPCSFS